MIYKDIKIEKSDIYFIVSGIDKNNIRRSLDIFTSETDAARLVNDIKDNNIIVYFDRHFITPYKQLHIIKKTR